MRSTMREIARKTGYSVATVSRALSGSSKVAPGAKRAILVCARESGYRAESRRVAVIVPGSYFGAYYGDVLGCLASELKRYGYSFEILEAANLDVLEECPFCGAISAMAQNGLERYWGERHIMPLVCINTQPRHLDGIYTVGSNDEQGVKLVVDHLLERGHRRIGRFGGMGSFTDPTNWNSTHRERAFRRLLAEHGLETELFAYCGGATPTVIEAVKSLLDRGTTAIVTVNEGVELATHHALRVLSVRVPEDVALVSWTQPNPAALVTPSITGLEQDFPRLVEKGCETFRKLLAGEPAEDILVDYRLEVRESSAIALPDRKNRQENPGKD